MPTYEYLCRHCGHTFEELQSMSEEPLIHCPRCNQDTLAKVLGTGAGLIFKGSGFYLTDYKKSNSSPAALEEHKKPASSDAKPASPKPDASATKD